MGGGPNNPVLIEDDDVTLGSRVNALVIKDEPDNDHKVVIKKDDSDDEKEGVLDGEDVDSEMDEPAVTAHKGELTRELKALGINPRQKPDYTKPLNEPSWGDSEEEENSDVDMDAEGILSGEDESDEYEDDDMEEDEMVERIKAGKNGIVASHRRQPINPMRDPDEAVMGSIDKMLPPNNTGAWEIADERAQRECETINTS
ncbi:hypothetical protein F5882DRAFT_37982 [Hyaloscypha sp. PMI_1271]|nr:hypothetical protein F5882DRAFT_37982 [Hyaloscypha sp. PMI_1271]